MTGNEIALVVRMTAREGKEKNLQDLCTSLLPKSRSEAGCILYNFHQVIDSGSEFVFYEIWKDQQAFDQHNEMPYLKDFLAKVGDLVASDPELIFLNQLES